MSENMKLPLIGDRAPEFTAQTTKGVIDFPNGYKGKWVVLFSHPGDFTPVCTTEFYSFASRAGDFKALGTELIGLSVDQVYAHMKWTEWIKEKLGKEIPFPVIADSTGKVATKYGMLQPEANGTQAVRAVFILDGEGVIRTILYYPLSVGRNMDEILRIIKALQVSDKEGVSLPANWPKNELIGDRVIVPAPSSEDEAKDRTKKYECYDWWFCHRKLE